MKKSELLPCPICGKEVRARGLKSHIRLQHKSNTTVQVNDEENIDYDIEETYEELQKTKDFYDNVWKDEKMILKFVASIPELSIPKDKCKLDMQDILVHFCFFLNAGGKTDKEIFAV